MFVIVVYLMCLNDMGSIQMEEQIIWKGVYGATSYRRMFLVFVRYVNVVYGFGTIVLFLLSSKIGDNEGYID